MYAERKKRQELESKIIDVHSHVGIHAGMYEGPSYPYCQSLESLYYRQLSSGVDVNVVFPFGSYPTNVFPYDIDNHMLMKEVYEFCPEISDRFLPFICMDTANQVAAQVTAAKKLAEKFQLYGIKINPVDRQVPVITLLNKGREILDFAEQFDIPLIFHAVPTVLDGYSSAEDILNIAERFSSIRFCLAHCMLFCKDLLDRAATLPNVWVDTAAIKIQVDLANELLENGKLEKQRLLDADFNDYMHVMLKLVTAYPDLIIWGSDSPAYTFITRRQQAKGEFFDFKLPGRYEDEVNALKCLPPASIKTISNENTLRFLFG